jgi:hypothetical protein
MNKIKKQNHHHKNNKIIHINNTGENFDEFLNILDLNIDYKKNNLNNIYL